MPPPSQSGEGNSLSQQINALKTERNFFNSYRFCCAAFILVLLLVLFITTGAIFLLLSTFHSIPKIGNAKTLVDELQIDIRGFDGLLDYTKNMPDANKAAGEVSVSGICRVRILLGNPFNGRLKIGNITGAISLGTDSHQLAKFNLKGLEAIDPGGYGEHSAEVVFELKMHQIAGGALEILQHAVSTTSRNIGVSVHIEFRDIWIDLWFSKRWTVGFDISGTIYLNNDLGIEMLGLCPATSRLLEMDYKNFFCHEYWADKCAPCVECKFIGSKYECEAVADESRCHLKTCREKMNVIGQRSTRLARADVIGVDCEEDLDFGRRLHLDSFVSDSPLHMPNGSHDQSARRQLNLKNYEPREEHFRRYYQQVGHHYDKETCRRDAVAKWLSWFRQVMEKSFVGTMMDDLQKGILPVWPSNPSGTLFYHFFLPLLLGVAHMFILACCVCLRVFSAYRYYVYQGRRRERNLEEDKKYMERFKQHHPGYGSSPVPTAADTRQMGSAI